MKRHDTNEKSMVEKRKYKMNIEGFVKVALPNFSSLAYYTYLFIFACEHAHRVAPVPGPSTWKEVSN